MLDFAFKVATESHAIEEVDFERLAGHGFGDEDIWDIGAITAFFSYGNRMANLLDMRPNDESLPAWSLEGLTSAASTGSEGRRAPREHVASMRPPSVVRVGAGLPAFSPPWLGSPESRPELPCRHAPIG